MSIIIATFISTLIGFIFYFLYINISSGISYYTLDGIDEKRFVITAPSNILQLLSRDSSGIPNSVLEKISRDQSIERYREFRFLDISVLGKFDIFKFSLDIDIPTFSVRDSNAINEGIGISSRMLKYYNFELALSHPFFPVFSESDIMGKGVTLVFGASKLFSLPEIPESIYASKITHIDTDYPGFGVVIPYNIAETEMQKLGYTQSSPYKVIGYMRDASLREDIESRYSDYQLKFDADAIAEQKRTLEAVAQILLTIMCAILSILYGFLFLLFLGYFREKEYVFSLIRQYKISKTGRYFLVLLEPILLIVLGILTYTLVCFIGQNYIVGMLQEVLQAKNIFFPLLTLSVGNISTIGVITTLILTGLLLCGYLLKKK